MLLVVTDVSDQEHVTEASVAQLMQDTKLTQMDCHRCQACLVTALLACKGK